MPSKMSFIPDDNSLGRIDTLSIAPPHTVASLKRRIMNAEGVINQTINLFKDTDGEALMNETDHIYFLDPLASYPGQTEDEPIAIVCGAVFQESRGKDKERQGKDGKRRRRDEGRRREDSDTQLRETRRVDGERELSHEINDANHALSRRFKVTPTRGMSTLIIRVALIQFLQISSRFTFIFARVACVENGRDYAYRRN
jgi:hypothetical protein